MSDIWVCIAAKNEAETIGPLVEDLCGYGFKVAVTDDGSKDATYHHASKAGACLVWHGRSRGIAASVMDAWDAALAEGAEMIVQLDAGGSHDPADAFNLSVQSMLTDADVVIGSRFLYRSRYTGRPWRAMMSRLASLACSIKTGSWITDWTGGLRAFKSSAIYYLLNFCDFEAQMHGWQIEVLGKAIKAGMSIAEAPITYTAGESSFDLSVAREAFDVWRHL